MRHPKEGFTEWFAKVVRSGGIHFMVRPHINELPCGCVSSGIPFILKKRGLGYIHPTCGQAMPKPDGVEKSSTSKVTQPPKERGTYFVR